MKILKTIVLAIVIPFAAFADGSSSVIQKVLADVMAELDNNHQYHLKLPQRRLSDKNGKVQIMKGWLDHVGAPAAQRRMVYKLNYVKSDGAYVPEAEWPAYTIKLILPLPVMPANAAVGTRVEGPSVTQVMAIGTLGAIEWFNGSIVAIKRGVGSGEIEYFAAIGGRSKKTVEGEVENTQLNVSDFFPLDNTMCGLNPDKADVLGCAVCPGGPGTCPMGVSFSNYSDRANRIEYRNNSTGNIKTCTANSTNDNDCLTLGNVGDVFEIKALPVSGCQFSRWTGGTVTSACRNSAICSADIRDQGDYCDTLVSAEFDCATSSPKTLTVNKTGSGSVSSSPAGISCGADCSNTFPHGTSVTLNKSAGAGYHFVRWTGACTGSGSCTVVMDSNTTVGALFEANQNPSQYTLTVTKTGAGSGVVSAPTGIDCGSNCSYDYDANATVVLTSAANSGSIFTGYSGACSGSGTCVVTMDQAKSVTANFAVAATLGVTRAGNGTGTITSSPIGISCPGDCSQAYAIGTLVTLTAAPAADSAFTGFSGACTGIGPCTITMNAAKNVTATFTSYGLDVLVNGYGSGTVSAPGISCPGDCHQDFRPGTNVTLVAAPTIGSTVQWSIPSCGASTTCQISMSSARSVTATFTVAPGLADLQLRVAFENYPASECALPTTPNPSLTLNPRLDSCNGRGRFVVSWNVTPVGRYNCDVSVSFQNVPQVTLYDGTNQDLYLGVWMVRGHTPSASQVGQWQIYANCTNPDGVLLLKQAFINQLPPDINFY